MPVRRALPSLKLTRQRASLIPVAGEADDGRLKLEREARDGADTELRDGPELLPALPPEARASLKESIAGAI